MTSSDTVIGKEISVSFSCFLFGCFDSMHASIYLISNKGQTTIYSTVSSIDVDSGPNYKNNTFCDLFNSPKIDRAIGRKIIACTAPHNVVKNDMRKKKTSMICMCAQCSVTMPGKLVIVTPSTIIGPIDFIVAIVRSRLSPSVS